MGKLPSLILCGLCSITAVFSQETQIFKHWQLAFHAGAEYFLASSKEGEKLMIDQLNISPGQAKNYYQKLKPGKVLAADLHYLFKETWGVGLKCIHSWRTNDDDFLLGNSEDKLSFLVLGIDERMYVTYAGPSFKMQQWLGSNRRWMCAAIVSLGYVYYRDEVRYAPNLLGFDNSLITGETVGENIEVAIEYYTSPGVSIFANAGAFFANLRTLHFNSATTSRRLEPEQPENISHLALSLGFKFHF
ncbi:MAG: hypothetical protein LBH04_04110 [Tannerellaceae bacterium]|jgi:hypothetical protein|nr:hypothetical protein [Tannerellaceae bacterium]